MITEHYPTKWAYERACEALEKTKSELETSRDAFGGAILEIASLRDQLAASKKNYYDVADAICAESNGAEDLATKAREIRAKNKQLRSALAGLRDACIYVLLPIINAEIEKGLVVETWTAEQMQWAQAVKDTDEALS